MKENIRKKEIRGLSLFLVIFMPFLVVQLYLFYFEYIPAVVDPYAATLPEDLYMPIETALKKTLGWMLVWPATLFAIIISRLWMLLRSID